MPLFRIAASVRVDPCSTSRILFDLTLDSMIALSPALGLFMVLGLAAGLGQSGFLLTTQPIVPKLEKISPLAGFKRLFSLKSIVEFIQGVLKLAIVAAIAYALVSPEMDRAEELLDMDLIDVLREIQPQIGRA